MKKITIYISVLASIVLFFSACELNDAPEFDDANAYVAFDEENLSIAEDTGTVNIPVRLTSLEGLASSVSFDFIDSTAVKGRDYNLKGGASVLNFDGSEAVQNIQVDIINNSGVFTGDLKFGIRITSSGSVNAGGIDTMWVTILDLDHPLASILGTYTVNGPNYFSGYPGTWDVTIEKDPEGDVSKVWIDNLVVSGTNQKVYGVVNDEKTKIEIPVGQTIVTSNSYESIVLEGFDSPDVNAANLLPTGSKLTMELTSSSPVTFVMDLPFGSHIIDVNSWYSIVLANATFTKK